MIRAAYAVATGLTADDFPDVAVSDLALAPMEDLPFEHRQQQQALKHAENDADLKQKYGNRLLTLMAGQLIVTNVLIALVLWRGYDWQAPVAMVNVYIGSTFVELVGLAYVVVRHLFPHQAR